MRLQEFYPAQFGAFEEESSSSYNSFKQESGYDVGPDGDEDNTDFENEDVLAGLTECEEPKYRQLVRAKKAELKSQYGKGHFKKPGECGGKPDRIAYAPNIKISPIYIFGKKINDGNIAEYDRATARFGAAMAVWHECNGGNSSIWVPGWRAKWRDFKNNDGKAQLKAQSKCETSGGTPYNAITPTAPTQTSYTPGSLTCEQMKSLYGIVPGSTWGTAPLEIRLDWQKRQCFVPQSVTQTGTSGVDEIFYDETVPAGKKLSKAMVTIIVSIVSLIILTAFVLWILKRKNTQNA